MYSLFVNNVNKFNLHKRIDLSSSSCTNKNVTVRELPFFTWRGASVCDSRLPIHSGPPFAYVKKIGPSQTDAPLLIYVAQTIKEALMNV